MTTPTDRPESSGWLQQNIQLPRDLRKIFRAAAGQRKSAGIKILGTTGIALILAMPEHVRKRLTERVAGATWNDPNDLTIEAVWEEFQKIMREPDDGSRYVDRILDPSFTGAADPTGEGRRAG